MAEEEKKNDETTASDDEGKLDIEDIKDPQEPDRSDDHPSGKDSRTGSGGDLDIEEAVSEDEPGEVEEESGVEPEGAEPEETEKVKETDEKSQGSKKPKPKEKKPGKKSEKEVKGPEAEVDEKDALEQAVEEQGTEEKPKAEKEKGHFWKNFLMVSLTALVTAALALGAAWWWFNRSSSKKEEAQAPATETTTAPVAETAAKKYFYVTAKEGLRLRKEPNPNAEILETMPYGTKLQVLETSGDWIKTTYNNKTGWCILQYLSNENPLIYKNTSYGFEMTFPETWSTYKLFPNSNPGSGVTAAYYVALLTSDSNYNESTLGEKGYVSLFAIEIYTKAQWTAAQAEEGPKPIKAAEGSTYVVGYSLPNGIRPADMEARSKEVKDIIATIKFD